ncbi:MAG: DUF3877 family protein [Lachnospiraceae bacterium]|nr:DUF3877 family protein [Lachnospiraceae bacterium]
MERDCGMNIQNLERNIVDLIEEEQIKLGYLSETVRLYYPLDSLNRFLQQEYDTAQMQAALKEFSSHVQERLGEIQVSHKGSRFCLAVPPEGAAYIYKHSKKDGFLTDFIRTIEKHGCTLEDLLQQFWKYSCHVHVEKADHGEFDYLVYFEDGIPDEFRYCLTDEGCHMIYHRFTIDDYNDFHFDE